MQALIIIDAQNEFTAAGKRPVPSIQSAIEAIRLNVEQARKNGSPIAWIRHFNKPHESPAFAPGTWGSEFIRGLGPQEGFGVEKEFHKDVYGAFTGTNIGLWLKDLEVSEVLIVGFYTHGCVSTTAREALMAGLTVKLDANATGSCDITYEGLGTLYAEQVKRTALLHLAGLGATIFTMTPVMAAY